MCPFAVGFGISFINKKRKLFYCGTFALLSFAAIYHGIFNMMQISCKYIGSFLPVVTFVPVFLLQGKLHQKKKKSA